MTTISDITDELNDPGLSFTRLSELCTQLQDGIDSRCGLTVKDEIKIIESLSYHSIHEGVDLQINKHVLKTIDCYFRRNAHDHDGIMQALISSLQPLLLKGKSNSRAQTTAKSWSQTSTWNVIEGRPAQGSVDTSRRLEEHSIILRNSATYKKKRRIDKSILDHSRNSKHIR